MSEPKVKKTKYVFIIDTNEYAGNFEREMTAFCVGQIGDCEVGYKEEERFKEELGEDFWEVMEGLIEQRADDHGCCRPTEIQPGPDKDYNSVGIFFYDKPKQDIINMIKERAREFTHTKQRTMKILGYRLKKEILSTEYMEI
jgi:hypothetical protein